MKPLRELADLEHKEMTEPYKSNRQPLKSNLVNAEGSQYHDDNFQCNYELPYNTSMDANAPRSGDFQAQANYMGNANGNRSRWSGGNNSGPNYERSGNNSDRRNPPFTAEQWAAWQEELKDRFKHACIFCLSDEHESKVCTQLSPLECGRLLRRYRLCYNCRGQGHGNRDCAFPKTCTKPCSDTNKHCTQVCAHRA